ncbi:MAG: hypothetical protein EOO40_11625, partial [Deltaproteobacteria bacterium]
MAVTRRLARRVRRTQHDEPVCRGGGAAATRRLFGRTPQVFYAQEVNHTLIQTLRFVLVVSLCAASSACHSAKKVAPSDPNSTSNPAERVDDGFQGPFTRIIGRTSQDTSLATGTILSWPAVTLLTRFEGTKLHAELDPFDGVETYFDITVDDMPQPTFTLDTNTTAYDLTVPQGIHTVKMVRRDESNYGRVAFGGFTTDGNLMLTATPPTRLIEFIGDSITAGYG